MSSMMNDQHEADEQPMRSIEQEILLASTGELSVVRRLVLWLRLRFDGDARRYAGTERIVRLATAADVSHRRIYRHPALVSLSAAAALVLAFGLWQLYGWSNRSITAEHEIVAMTSEQILETPLISRTKQLAVRAEGSLAVPYTIQLAHVGATGSSQDVPTMPLWSRQQLARSPTDAFRE